MKNLINFQVSISQKDLSHLVTKAIDESINNESINVDSYKINLVRKGAIDILPIDKCLRLELPYDVSINKQAGLFSVEGRGGANLVFNFRYDVSSDMKLSTSTELLSHSWISKPKLDLGLVNIPVEKLLDLAISKYKPIICQKIDTKLSAFSDIRVPLTAANQNLSEQIKKVNTRGINPSFEISKLNLIPVVQDEDGLLHLNGSVQPEISFSDLHPYSNIKDFSLEWIDYVDDNNSVCVDISLSYDFIIKSILDNISNIEVGNKQLELSDLNISNVNGRLTVNARVLQPIKANLDISGFPIFSSITSNIELDDLIVKVNPDSFIYKVATPLVNTVIKNKLSEIFPCSINSLIDEHIVPMIPKSIPYPMGAFDVKYDKISVESLKFDKEIIDVKAVIKNLFLKTTIRSNEV